MTTHPDTDGNGYRWNEQLRQWVPAYGDISPAEMAADQAFRSQYGPLSHDRKDLYSITNQHNLSRLVCGIDDETSVVWGYNSSGVYQASGLTTGTTLITTPWGATRTLPTNVTPNPNGARMLRWNDKVFLVCWNSSTSVMEVYSADPQSGSSPTWTWSSLLHSLAANARVIGTCVSGGASGLFIAEYSGSSAISGGPSLYRTTDGTTFETVLGPLADTRHFHAVAEDPYNPGHIYVTAGDSSASPAWVWKSTDGGDTWDEVETLNEVYWQAVKIDFDEDWVYFWSDQYQSGGNVYICDRETMTPQWFTPHRVDRIAVPGATNARVLTDCAHATSDATLTSSSGAFTSRDRGRLIGGTAFFALGTYVQSVTSSTEVELSAGALGGGSLTNRTVAMLGDTFFAAGYHGGIDPDTGYVYCVANDTSSAGTTGGLFVCTRRGEPWQLLNTFYIPVAGEVDSAMYIKDGWAFIGAYGPIRLLTV